LVAAAVAAAVLVIRSLTAPSEARVPQLRGLNAVSAAAAVRHAGLRASFVRHYSSAPPGTLISQSPHARAVLSSGSIVRVVLSRGLRPVEVPSLTGQSTTAARSILASLHLAANVDAVPAPGTAPGTVTGQQPTGGHYLTQQRVVTLLVAEVPQWRTVTSFSGDSGDSSVPFRIRGMRWRALYAMSYNGPCTFIIFCEGPSASAVDTASGRTVNQFDLNQGNEQTQVFGTGPGIYQLKVSPGLDAAQWSVDIQDYY
jgi:PASTA domain